MITKINCINYLDEKYKYLNEIKNKNHKKKNVNFYKQSRLN